jgi:hypothetical protein
MINNNQQYFDELNKAISLFNDGTYVQSDLVSHIKQILTDTIAAGCIHKRQLEHLLFKNWELRNMQRQYYAGHKQALPDCKRMQKELELKVNNLLKIGNYSIERYKAVIKQTGLF